MLTCKRFVVHNKYVGLADTQLVINNHSFLFSKILVRICLVGLQTVHRELKVSDRRDKDETPCQFMLDSPFSLIFL